MTVQFNVPVIAVSIDTIYLFIKVFASALLMMALGAAFTYLRFTPGESYWYRQFLWLFISLDGKTRRFWWVWWILSAATVALAVIIYAWYKGKTTL